MRFVPDTPATPTEWQICFVGEARRAPWDWFLAKFYRHVFALGYLLEHDVWLCYDVSCFKTEITVLSNVRAGWLLNWARGQGGIITVPAPGYIKPRFALRLGFWCVPAVKHILGLRCVAMTPKGLHDYLLRHGARPETKHEPVQQSVDPSAAAPRA
jgi:hypothetical protein